MGTSKQKNWTEKEWDYIIRGVKKYESPEQLMKFAKKYLKKYNRGPSQVRNQLAYLRHIKKGRETNEKVIEFLSLIKPLEKQIEKIHYQKDIKRYLRRRAKRLGLKNVRELNRLFMRGYRERHGDRYNAYHRDYTKRNPEKRKEAVDNYLKNPENLKNFKAWHKIYSILRKRNLNAYQRAYDILHREEIRKYREGVKLEKTWDNAIKIEKERKKYEPMYDKVLNNIEIIANSNIGSRYDMRFKHILYLYLKSHAKLPIRLSQELNVSRELVRRYLEGLNHPIGKVFEVLSKKMGIKPEFLEQIIKKELISEQGRRTRENLYKS